MDFLAEYEEMMTIPPKSAVAFKFLSLFRVALDDSKEPRGLYWSESIRDNRLSDEVLKAIKAYLKTMRAVIRKGAEKDFARILWFFYQKLLEVGAFDITVRAEIRAYLDLCQYIIL